MKQKIDGLLKLANSGDAEAQFLLARAFDVGDGVDVDKTKAIYWYIKAANQGEVSAQFNLGNMYYNGDGVDVDKSKAFKFYSKAAQQGDADAQFAIAYMYQNGDGIDVDKSKAFELYTKAAEQGDADAQNNLAYMYFVGDGVDVDKFKAFEFYSKSAQKGNPDAQYALAGMYYLGIGVDIDKAQALYWCSKAAQQGNPDAQYTLARMYDEGRGVDIDKSKAFDLFKNALENGLEKEAEQGDAEAQFALARMYYEGLGVGVDKSKATYWYTKAAEQGHESAQFNLASMYFDGDGVDADKSKASILYKTAFELYIKEAEQGNADAQFALAYLYDHGLGVDIDKTKAFYWCSKAAQQGLLDAQLSLATMYYNGEGVEINKTKAFELLNQAANNGEGRSAFAAALVLLELNEDLKAKGYLESFIKQQSKDKEALSDAYYRLSTFYIEWDTEKGKREDFVKAKEYLDKAVDLGSEDAKELVKAINEELRVGDSQNNRMGLLAKELIEKNIPISNLNEEAEKIIRERFGEMYNYLKPGTKAGLVTSLLTYVSFMYVGEDKYRNLDFSSVINPITKSLEIELKHVFYTCFMDYLIKNNIPPTEFDPDKQYFVREIKQKTPNYEDVNESEINREIANIEEYNYYKQKKYDRSSAIEYVIGENNNAFSLGGIQKFIAIQKKFASSPDISYVGRNKKINVVTRKEITIDKHFLNYIRDVFKDDAFPTYNRDQEIKKYLLKLVNKVGDIAFGLRNPSNHTQIMECWRATYCGNIIFMKDNFLVDFLSKIKPEYL